MTDQLRLYVDEELFLGRLDEAIAAYQHAIELDSTATPRTLRH
jgi:hypothetical protein